MSGAWSAIDEQLHGASRDAQLSDGRGIFVAGESRVDWLASFVLKGKAFFVLVLVGHGERKLKTLTPVSLRGEPRKELQRGVAMARMMGDLDLGDAAQILLGERIIK